MVSVTNLLDQCRHRTTIVFGNLGRWPNRVTYYEQDYPYTLIFEPNFGAHNPRSFGETVIVFTNHLDLTWDKGVELRYFQVGRPPSHRVWDSYQSQTTDAYILDFIDCTRVADVYVKWLMWLDDWDGSDPEVICITVNHAGQTSKSKIFDPTPKRMPVFVWYTTRYPRVWPWNTYPFALFAHANVFHHGGQPVPIELSIASFSEDGKDPEVICLTGITRNSLRPPKTAEPTGTSMNGSA
ncbi:uncharacterized protein TNCV_1462651 [Trichonephila clavipes]|nr:uncharacterized protein TNCV_1462651 [Trichonephila clavipes]